MTDHRLDLAIVGAGAAGLSTAIAASRMRPGLRVACFEGARSVGAKILVSGGSRCNVTNREVNERDFRGGSARAVRAVLRAFSAARVVEFFREIGVPLHEEDGGKLFPDTNRARTVLEALLAECARLGVEIRTGERVSGVRFDGHVFTVVTDGEREAAAVVLATGGRSLPKSGSDGFGYELARGLGHGLVATTPALVPLLLDGAAFRALAGVSHPAAVTVRDGGKRFIVSGSLLWTHVGVSGPVALDASRHWHRVVEEGRTPHVELNLVPAMTFEALASHLLAAGVARPTATVARELAAWLPAAVVEVVLAAADVNPATTMAHLTREDRRVAIRTLVALQLRVTGSRGYQYAEVTAGGVALDEVDSATMESRVCSGLYLAGEILDVDGRLGGFNFQWAWSSGWVAGTAVARRASPR
jgi:predicted Rossmann fold flavoprotein